MSEHPQRLRRSRARRRRRRGPADETERGDPDGTERPAGSGDRRDAAEHRTEERTADGSGERGADQAAAPPRWRGRDEPGQRARPRERARHSLQETGHVELPRLGGDPEEHRAEGDGSEPDQHRGLYSGPRGDDTARDGPDECAGRVRGRQHARACLVEPERVRVVWEQRRECCKEERVEENNRTR